MDICSFVFLSVGPVRPRGGGIYSIIEDVVCKAYVLRTGLKPNNCGYMQFCLCLWALSGPGVGYIQLLRTVCVKYICLKLAHMGPEGVRNFFFKFYTCSKAHL